MVEQGAGGRGEWITRAKRRQAKLKSKLRAGNKARKKVEAGKKDAVISTFFHSSDFYCGCGYRDEAK